MNRRVIVDEENPLGRETIGVHAANDQGTTAHRGNSVTSKAVPRSVASSYPPPRFRFAVMSRDDA